MAEHGAQGWGQPWSGTPDDLVRLAREGQQIVRSAGHGDPAARIKVELRGGREMTYASPEEFIAGLAARDVNRVTGVVILWFDPTQRTNALTVTAVMTRGFRRRPLVIAEGADPSIAEGAMRNVVRMFDGNRWWQGLRTSEVSRFQRVRTYAVSLWVLVVAVAITAIVTIIVTRLLTPPH